MKASKKARVLALIAEGVPREEIIEIVGVTLHMIQTYVWQVNNPEKWLALRKAARDRRRGKREFLDKDNARRRKRYNADRKYRKAFRQYQNAYRIRRLARRMQEEKGATE